MPRDVNKIYHSEKRGTTEEMKGENDTVENVGDETRNTRDNRNNVGEGLYIEFMPSEYL